MGALILFLSAFFLASAPNAALSWQDHRHPLSGELLVYEFGRAGALHLQKAIPTPQIWDFFTEEPRQGSSEVGVPLINGITVQHQIRSLTGPSLPIVTNKVSPYLFNSVLIL
jgi:hypothetical protein